jgi:hypothetical protein
MLEFAASGLLGSLFGGLFRLAPEILKFFDRKDDRKHELSMYGLQIDLEKTKGQVKIEEKYIDYGIANTQAIQSAFESQAKEASNSYRWVAALSALVRPMVTYVLFGMYVTFKIIVISYAMQNGANWIDIANKHWTPDDFAMLNMILTFWFLGRSIEKRSGS